MKNDKQFQSTRRRIKVIAITSTILFHIGLFMLVGGGFGGNDKSESILPDFVKEWFNGDDKAKEVKPKRNA